MYIIFFKASLKIYVIFKNKYSFEVINLINVIIFYFLVLLINSLDENKIAKEIKIYNKICF
jgi:hypothetical protein